MGAPLNITREQTAELRQVADGLRRGTLTVGDDGVLDIDLTLPAWAVALVAPTLPGGQPPGSRGDEPGSMRQ
jgi:xylan 1,4-beta-xylosidase